jgi:gliding motility-associated-like protein
VYQNPDYKSFASTCLTIPLKKDSLYRLDFFAGFGTPGSEYLNVNGQLLGPSASPSPETFGLFGEPDCSAVGNPIPLYSCIQRAGWISLGSVEVKSGPGTWQKVSILFTPPMDMQAIAVGPGCDTNFTSFPISGTYNGESYRTNTYSYFIDSLQFYEAGAPPPQVSLVSGDSCTPTIVLEMQPAAFYATSVLQWYRNDTLVSGQQASTLTIPRMNAGTALYSCQVKNDSVCLVSNPFPVNWTPLPNASVLGSPDTTVCTDSVLLNAFTDSAFHYVWQDGSTQPYFFATQNGTYTVSISDGCGTTRAQKTVYFATCDFNAHVPNAFTPNGDGRNDVFRALFFFPPILFNIRIFNRNGLEVFSSTDPSRGWDGNFNNTKQPAGAYIWTIRFSDLTGKPHSLIGTLVLIR